MASAPKPNPRPIRTTHRHLRLVPGGQQARKRRGSPAHLKRPKTRGTAPSGHPAAIAGAGLRFAVVATIVVAAFVFGLVLLHVLLAQSAFRLQSLQKQVTQDESRNRQMRYQVATAEAPARIAESAAAIGLVVPDQQRYLLLPDSVRLAEKSRDRSGDPQVKALLEKER